MSRRLGGIQRIMKTGGVIGPCETNPAECCFVQRGIIVPCCPGLQLPSRLCLRVVLADGTTTYTGFLDYGVDPFQTAGGGFTGWGGILTKNPDGSGFPIDFVGRFGIACVGDGWLVYSSTSLEPGAFIPVYAHNPIIESCSNFYNTFEGTAPGNPIHYTSIEVYLCGTSHP